LCPYWIEGIGSPRGLFSPVMLQVTNGDSWELVCFKQNDILIYRNPNYNNCAPLIGNIENNFMKNNSIKIYPNPIIGVSILDAEDIKLEVQTLEIFNILGKCVKHLDISKERKIKLIRNEYVSGLYLFKITGKNAVHISGKFIIN
ncbi:MAG: T9SS type A sorting domain-containing protein, partial [Bacteroidota bacterium]